jgi:acyl-CoA synthetase (AMP-forming)/AMP-acid ligase II
VSAARVVTDADPQAVLAALEGPGPVAVLDHRRPGPAPAVADALPRAPSGTWLVAATSGTTGAPRAVCRTRGSWQASVEPFSRLTGTTSRSRVLVPGPLASTLFLYAAWQARQVGARPLLEPLATTQPWDVAHVVPAQLQTLLDGATEVDGRTVVVAGAALPAHLARTASTRGLRVVAYYGAAELSFVAAGSGGGPMAAFPGVQVDERDGVLWVRSPYLCTGYLPGNAPGPLRRDADGWMSVGDRGHVRGGLVEVHGRGGQAVQTGGVTVHVADVEAALLGAPGVRDVVVVGTPHAGLGAVVTAVVEVPDPPPSTAALRAHAAAHLPPQAVPRRWVLVPALPRTAAGKIDRLAAARLS